MSQYQFKTTNIRGKQYVEVNERIKFFRQEEQYKNWGITTEFPMLTPDECLCRCTITDKDGMVIAVGHAHENRTASNINKTSYVENCETSAVGRALAMLGIGIDTLRRRRSPRPSPPLSMTSWTRRSTTSRVPAISARHTT